MCSDQSLSSIGSHWITGDKCRRRNATNCGTNAFGCQSAGTRLPRPMAHWWSTAHRKRPSTDKTTTIPKRCVWLPAVWLTDGLTVCVKPRTFIGFLCRRLSVLRVFFVSLSSSCRCMIQASVSLLHTYGESMGYVHSQHCIVVSGCVIGISTTWRGS